MKVLALLLLGVIISFASPVGDPGPCAAGPGVLGTLNELVALGSTGCYVSISSFEVVFKDFAFDGSGDVGDTHVVHLILPVFPPWWIDLQMDVYSPLARTTGELRSVSFTTVERAGELYLHNGLTIIPQDATEFRSTILTEESGGYWSGVDELRVVRQYPEVIEGAPEPATWGASLLALAGGVIARRGKNLRKGS